MNILLFTEPNTHIIIPVKNLDGSNMLLSSSPTNLILPDSSSKYNVSVSETNLPGSCTTVSETIWAVDYLFKNK